jgi:hypothetical protein
VDGQVAGELRVKARDQDGALTGEDRITRVPGQHVDVGAGVADARRPDEDHAERHLGAIEPRRGLRLEGFPLPAVAIPLDGHVDQPERGLARALDLPGEDDQAGARAEERPAAPVERVERGLEVPRIHQVE